MDRETRRAGADEAGRTLLMLLDIGLWIGLGSRNRVQGIESGAGATGAIAVLSLGMIGTQWAIARGIRRLDPPFSGVMRTD